MPVAEIHAAHDPADRSWTVTWHSLICISPKLSGIEIPIRPLNTAAGEFSCKSAGMGTTRVGPVSSSPIISFYYRTVPPWFQLITSVFGLLGEYDIALGALFYQQSVTTAWPCLTPPSSSAPILYT